MATQMTPGTYKIAGVEMTVNAFGCLIECNDWEAVYERNERSEPHVGTHAKYFAPGFGGRLFATDAFREHIALWYTS